MADLDLDIPETITSLSSLIESLSATATSTALLADATGFVNDTLSNTVPDLGGVGLENGLSAGNPVMRAQALPKHSRPSDWQRPTWLLGMLAYIASQIFGSTLSLKYLRSDWVAPLGSTSLVFNFIFAKILVGIEVTKEDVRGTALIVLGVLCILIFSSINHGLDAVITVERLSEMWSRGNWLAWFFFITFSTFFTYEITHLLALLLKSRESLSPTGEFDPSLPPATGGGRSRAASQNPGGQGLSRASGRGGGASGAQRWRGYWMGRSGWEFGWGVFGVYKGGFAHFAPIVTVILVAVTAILQIICLNKGLKTADSTLVVPLFYAGYTVLGFVNSLIFMNETDQYETWALVAIFLSIGVLVAGVVLLSLKKTDPEDAPGHTVSATNPANSMRLNPLQASANMRSMGASSSCRGNARWANSRSTSYQNDGDEENQVVWEVGSISDESDVEKDGKEPHGRGVGGVRDVYGERGGLLHRDDDEEGKPAADKVEGYETVRSPSVGSPDRRRKPGNDEDDPFGDFEEAR
ncbi:hypothetical protein QFC20_004457 [Naganishia adeliensis]|uniref:Uncharacterized protein n=1 Tax=Naganishia adeliensis TaxID=92952 RepID=A0ACC2W1S4_9TREE|nr:hypothetical protein QFC20_004457 [Naganishia adeliensis]